MSKLTPGQQFYNELVAFADRYEISIADLCRAAKTTTGTPIPRSMITRWKNGTQNPSYPSVVRFQDAMKRIEKKLSRA